MTLALRLLTTCRDLHAEARRCWRAAVTFAGSAAGTWLVGAMTVANALFVAAHCRNEEDDSVLISLVSNFTGRHEGTGCWFPGRRNTLFAVSTDDGGWEIHPYSESTAEIEAFQLRGATQVSVRRGMPRSFGVWSPSIGEERWTHLCSRPDSLSQDEETRLRRAIADAWPSLARVPGVTFAQTPLEPFELEALNRGEVPARRYVRWGWLLNDGVVLTAFLLFSASHPQRLARWRARRKRHLVTCCPQCRYSLAGIAFGADRRRQCPECGGFSTGYAG